MRDAQNCDSLYITTIEWGWAWYEELSSQKLMCYQPKPKAEGLNLRHNASWLHIWWKPNSIMFYYLFKRWKWHLHMRSVVQLIKIMTSSFPLIFTLSFHANTPKERGIILWLLSWLCFVFPYLHDVISLNMTLNMILSHSMLWCHSAEYYMPELHMWSAIFSWWWFHSWLLANQQPWSTVNK
jgi:hypothetical protein